MDKPERLHRPDPERDGPNRSALSFHAGRRDWRPRERERPHANGSDPRRGRLGAWRQARIFGDRRSDPPGRATGGAPAPRRGKAGRDRPRAELGHLLERALNVYKDMGALALTAAEALARSPVLQSGLSRAWPGNGGSEPRAGVGRGVHDSQLNSFPAARPMSTLDLRPTLGTAVPLVHALHAVNPAYPPLTGAHFTFEPNASAPVLHIAVPDAQPAATYSGVIVDGGTNQPCGTLSVRILP